jgi:hypothetical protein
MAAMKTPAPHWSWVSNLLMVPDIRKAYVWSWALSTKTLDLSITVNLVVLEDRELGLLALVLDLFWGGVNLLLALLGSST